MLKPSTASGKYHRVFVLGIRSSGKSSILNQVIFSRGPGCDQLLKTSSVSSIPTPPVSTAHANRHTAVTKNGHTSSHHHSVSTLSHSTSTHYYSEEQNVEKCFIKDIYSALILNEEKAMKERIHFCEVPIETSSAIGQIEMIKDFINSADGIILVYSIDSFESFQIIDMLKRSIDKSREKRDIPVVALGNKLDRFRERKVDATACQAWAVKENVHLCEVTATERKSLIEPFVYLASRLHPASQSKFDRFNKLSSKRSTSQMTMELWFISVNASLSLPLVTSHGTHTDAQSPSTPINLFRLIFILHSLSALRVSRNQIFHDTWNSHKHTLRLTIEYRYHSCPFVLFNYFHSLRCGPHHESVTVVTISSVQSTILTVSDCVQSSWSVSGECAVEASETFPLINRTMWNNITRSLLVSLKSALSLHRSHRQFPFHL